MTTNGIVTKWNLSTRDPPAVCDLLSVNVHSLAHACKILFCNTCCSFFWKLLNFPISRSFQAFTISMPNDLWRAARPSIRPSLLAGNLQPPSHFNEGLELECEPCLPCKTVLLTSRVSGALWALISGPQQLVNLLAASCFILSLASLPAPKSFWTPLVLLVHLVLPPPEHIPNPWRVNGPHHPASQKQDLVRWHSRPQSLITPFCGWWDHVERWASCCITSIFFVWHFLKLCSIARCHVFFSHWVPQHFHGGFLPASINVFSHNKIHLQIHLRRWHLQSLHWIRLQRLAWDVEGL